MDYTNTFLFGLYPYICMTTFFLGSLIRFDREQFTWKAGSSQMLRSKQLKLGSNLMHIGILLLFFGHFFGLLTPPIVYKTLGLTAPIKQMIAMIGGGIFGIMCFAGITLLVHRRLSEPRIRATSNSSDIFILILLHIQVTLGLLTIIPSMQNLDGRDMLLLSQWAQAIVTFQPFAAVDAMNSGELSIIYKAHIVIGLTMFLVFPFTRLVHIWSAPIWYLGRRYQIVRQR